MKKVFILLLLIFKISYGHCDVIYFPVPFSVFCYSTELISMSETIKNTRGTSGFWIGIGCVGSFFYPDHPVGGLEVALERRHYFRPDVYRHFFISGYIGGAFMTDFKDIINIGIVPGVKLNYKSQVSKRMVLEPYISLSLPVTYDVENSHPYIPFPTLTIGMRFGFSELINKIKS